MHSFSFIIFFSILVSFLFGILRMDEGFYYKENRKSILHRAKSKYVSISAYLSAFFKLCVFIACIGSQLQHTGSAAVVHWLSCSVACVILIPRPGIEPASRIHLQVKEMWFDPWVRKIPWSRKWQPTSVFLPEKNPCTEEPEWLQSIVLQGVGQTERLNIQAPVNWRADF